MLLATKPGQNNADALLILLEARERLAGFFDDWSDIEEIGRDHPLTQIAEAYRSISTAISHLGGPTLEAVYMLQNHVFADIPDSVDEAAAIADVVFRHCAAVASR